MDPHQSAGSLIFTDQIMTAACSSSASMPDHQETHPGHSQDDSLGEKTEPKAHDGLKGTELHVYDKSRLIDNLKDDPESEIEIGISDNFVYNPNDNKIYKDASEFSDN